MIVSGRLGNEGLKMGLRDGTRSFSFLKHALHRVEWEQWHVIFPRRTFLWQKYHRTASQACLKCRYDRYVDALQNFIEVRSVLFRRKGMIWQRKNVLLEEKSRGLSQPTNCTKAARVHWVPRSTPTLILVQLCKVCGHAVFLGVGVYRIPAIFICLSFLTTRRYVQFQKSKWELGRAAVRRSLLLVGESQAQIFSSPPQPS